MRREIREDAVAQIKRPEIHICDFGKVRVTRNGTTLLLEWTVYAGLFSVHTRCDVRATMRYVDLYPNAEALEAEALDIKKPGNGSLEIELSEGDCVQFWFIFRDTRLDPLDHKSSRGVHFFASIPLSDRARMILDRERGDDAEKMVGALDDFLDKEDQLNEALDRARARIRAKGYSPEDEERRIADAEDFARTLREKFGM